MAPDSQAVFLDNCSDMSPGLWDAMTEFKFGSKASAVVRLYMIVDGRQLELSQMGPTRVILREPIELEPCEADVIAMINGSEQRWRVFLVNGAVPFDDEVEIRDVLST